MGGLGHRRRKLPCGTKTFEIAVGFCVSASGDVDWVVGGGRCTAFNLVGVYADGGVEYVRSSALLLQA